MTLIFTCLYFLNFKGVPKNVTDSPNQFSQSKLNISSSMVNKTKEEKFKIDIDVSKLRLCIGITQEAEL